MELDVRMLPDGTTHAAEYCVIGAGPVGLTLAAALAGAGRSVAVIESGGHANDDAVTDLNDGDRSGHPLDDLRRTRARGIGGTARDWNTTIRGSGYAKLIPFDEVDFTARDWIPGSGWPFLSAELAPWYRRARAVAGLADEPTRSPPPFSNDHLIARHFALARRDRFTRELPTELAANADVLLLHGATVTELLRGIGGVIAAVRWRTASDIGGTVSARQFILATGAVENARILLLHRGPDSSPWLGCGFMEHPVDSSIRLFGIDPALGVDGFGGPHPDSDGALVIGGIGVAAELLREARLPNASLRLGDVPEIAPSRSILPRIWRRLRPRPPETCQVLLDLEQPPHRENRVTLSARRDRFGQPRATVHWEWRDDDEAARQRLLPLVVRALHDAGLGRAVIVPGIPLNPDAHHHAGTTRMHPDPRHGVVDATLRVHGEANLYVTGSSVFPTAGFANPTLTALALTLRLADHLAGPRPAP